MGFLEGFGGQGLAPEPGEPARSGHLYPLNPHSATHPPVGLFSLRSEKPDCPPHRRLVSPHGLHANHKGQKWTQVERCLLRKPVPVDFFALLKIVRGRADHTCVVIQRLRGAVGLRLDGGPPRWGGKDGGCRRATVCGGVSLDFTRSRPVFLLCFCPAPG